VENNLFGNIAAIVQKWGKNPLFKYDGWLEINAQ
jgi:hypothetical protein